MEDTIKNRTLNLTRPADEALIHELANMNGVSEVKAIGPAKLQIVYELMQTDLSSVENKIKELSNDLTRNFFDRFVRGWIHFTEENERTNIKAVPHCCSEEPKRE